MQLCLKTWRGKQSKVTQKRNCILTTEKTSRKKGTENFHNTSGKEKVPQKQTSVDICILHLLGMWDLASPHRFIPKMSSSQIVILSSCTSGQYTNHDRVQFSPLPYSDFPIDCTIYIRAEINVQGAAKLSGTENSMAFWDQTSQINSNCQNYLPETWQLRESKFGCLVEQAFSLRWPTQNNPSG